MEAKPAHDKSAPTVVQFLYELICEHGRFAIQINDQGRKFVNKISDSLREMTGTRQQVTTYNTYHPQSNSVVERHYRKVKNALVWVLDEKSDQWAIYFGGCLISTFCKSLVHKILTVLSQVQPRTSVTCWIEIWTELWASWFIWTIRWRHVWGCSVHSKCSEGRNSWSCW